MNPSERLELPITLRIALPNEVPMDETILKNIERSTTANLIEGYTLTLNEGNPEHVNLGFDFFSEINIDNSKLWILFVELASLLPDEVIFIVASIDDDEMYYSKYKNKNNILKFLHQYKKELTKDTFLKFGFLYHSDNELIEVFIDESKYIKFWGTNCKQFETVIQKLGLSKIAALAFIDEFPLVRLPLCSLDHSMLETEKLLEILKNNFQ